MYTCITSRFLVLYVNNIIIWYQTLDTLPSSQRLTDKALAFYVTTKKLPLQSVPDRVHPGLREHNLKPLQETQSTSYSGTQFC
jgi:hypothetical protein